MAIIESEDEGRIVGGARNTEDEFENRLRPKTMADFAGQAKVKENLSVYMAAAKKRDEALDHVLLSGPPGLGKTTLAHIIANELNSQIRVTSGPAIEKAADLAAILTNLGPGDILFIDEIHRLNHAVEEILYPALEDFSLDLVLGKGPSARSVRLPLPDFTLIGATTRSGMLSSPLRDRFGISFRLSMYSPEELSAIIKRSAGILNVSVDDGGAYEIARRSRGTPRIANRLLKRVRDFTEMEGKTVIDRDSADRSLRRIGIDDLGLDALDRSILKNMIEKFNGGPVGLDTLAAASGEESVTIEDVYEPYLMKIGFISRTPRGRVVLPAAYRHLGIPSPDDQDPTLMDIIGEDARRE